jgi:2,4-dienoyl-CoA reductase-like NADH-dependent reductase (Old Yellow Enzyme family)
MRIILEIVAAVRCRVTDKSFILGVKLNSSDFQKGGFGGDDSVEVPFSCEVGYIYIYRYIFYPSRI